MWGHCNTPGIVVIGLKGQPTLEPIMILWIRRETTYMTLRCVTHSKLPVCITKAVFRYVSSSSLLYQMVHRFYIMYLQPRNLVSYPYSTDARLRRWFMESHLNLSHPCFTRDEILYYKMRFVTPVRLSSVCLHLLSNQW